MPIVSFLGAIALLAFPVSGQSVKKEGVLYQVAQAKKAKDSDRFSEWRKEDFARKYKYLGRKNEDMRKNVVRIISQEYKDLIADKLLTLLESENHLERLSGVEIAAALPHERYKATLIKIMQSETVKIIRLKTYGNLRVYRTPDVSKALLAAYHEKERPVDEKEVILNILINNDYAPVVPVLEEALQDKDERIRIAALGGLAAQKAARYVDTFILAYDDPVAQVRYKVLKALQAYDFRNDHKIRVFLQKATTDENGRVKNLARKMLHTRGIH